jgi:hypothetical protein
MTLIHDSERLAVVESVVYFKNVIVYLMEYQSITLAGSSPEMKMGRKRKSVRDECEG